MQDLQKTWNDLQNTCSDLTTTWGDEEGTVSDIAQTTMRSFKDALTFNFGGWWNDQVHSLSDEGHLIGDAWHAGTDELRIAGDGLRILWDALQLAWKILRQWAEDIYHAVTNCLSTIGSFASTAAHDIQNFLGGAGAIVQEIIKDAQAFVTDEEKGNDLAALADFADMLVNPVRMMSGQQALTQQAMEQVILKKAPWLLTIFNKLPTWVKLLIIAILAIGVVGYLFLTGAYFFIS
ncbi:hypothetical protein [Tengunoibacter tsumagoiensis]|uniref:Uncharacterized protein n=1 Tax=Tengunoibacter tsumagoiensis TaxID=2014871 RepID=A0A402AA23_9CHLR|nr:hypothetical protein [Tengunoibacter tsumagoiensis]GCE15805.1 hypothetical protein KTT_56640 [Tengunoibacter tsumagoiensis]